MDRISYHKLPCQVSIHLRRSIVKIQIGDNEHGLAPQFFNESSLKSNGYLFYHKDSPDSLPKEQQTMLYEFIEDKNNYSKIKEKIEKYGGKIGRASCRERV